MRGVSAMMNQSNRTFRMIGSGSAATPHPSASGAHLLPQGEKEDPYRLSLREGS